MAAPPLNLVSFFVLFLFFFFFFSFSDARSPVLVLPVKKTPDFRQYVTQIYRGTPPAAAELVVDLGGSTLWIHGDPRRDSSTYKPARCRSVQCSLARSTRCGGNYGLAPGCGGDDACSLFLNNPVTGVSAGGEFVEDVVTVRFTDGDLSPFPGFLFSSGSSALLRGLAGGAEGIAGLGRSRLTLPSQLSAAFGFDRKFALCLSSSDGVIFFGDGPYTLPPGSDDVSKSLTYTPLFHNPSAAGAGEYFVGLKSIKINQKRVPLNSSLPSGDAAGVGGAKISTLAPYTLLETTIYAAVVDEFVKSAESMGLGRAAPVAPFSACFRAENNAVPVVVPTIDLVLQSELVYWRIQGPNSMATFEDKGVMCLALMDAGPAPGTSIVIGGHQLEDNLLQFDVAASRLGFAKSTCSDFRFTSNSSFRDVSSL